MTIDNIIISDKDYFNILKAIGYPVITEDTLSYLMTKEQIIDLVIEPSLETYYTHFPKRVPLSINSSGSNAIIALTTTDGVPENSFGVARAQFIPQSAAQPGLNPMDNSVFYQNPFYSASQVFSTNGMMGGPGMYGTPFGYGFETIRYQRMFYTKSLESSNKVYWYKFDVAAKTLYTKSNIGGSFYFELACVDSNIDNIDFIKKQSFLNYCKGMLKTQISEILGLVEMDLPIQLDATRLKEDGDKLIEDNLLYWRESSSIFGTR